MTYTPKLKKCSKCTLEKDPSEFNRKGSGLQPWCRDCNRRRSREYYAQNREKHRSVIADQNKRYVKRNQQYICEYLSKHPCVDCDETDIRTLDFDHLSQKEINVCKAIQIPWALSRIQEEIEKCEVVCANCHRIRTSNRGNHYRTRYLQRSTSARN